MRYGGSVGGIVPSSRCHRCNVARWHHDSVIAIEASKKEGVTGVSVIFKRDNNHCLLLKTNVCFNEDEIHFIETKFSLINPRSLLE